MHFKELTSVDVILLCLMVGVVILFAIKVIRGSVSDWRRSRTLSRAVETAAARYEAATAPMLELQHAKFRIILEMALCIRAAASIEEFWQRQHTPVPPDDGARIMALHQQTEDLRLQARQLQDQFDEQYGPHIRQLEIPREEERLVELRRAADTQLRRAA